MNNDALLKKVAQGLYSSAIEHKVVQIYREDFKFFVWNLKMNPDYFKFLKSPFVDYKDKCASLDEIFGSVFAEEFVAFIKILIIKELIGDVERIRQNFNMLADSDANILEGIIYTAFVLEKDQLSRICRAFSDKLGKKVVLKQREDESLIGGVKVLLDGVVYEYSINSKLENAKENLAYKINNGGEEDE